MEINEINGLILGGFIVLLIHRAVGNPLIWIADMWYNRKIKMGICKDCFMCMEKKNIKNGRCPECRSN